MWLYTVTIDVNGVHSAKLAWERRSSRRKIVITIVTACVLGTTEDKLLFTLRKIWVQSVTLLLQYLPASWLWIKSTTNRGESVFRSDNSYIHLKKAFVFRLKEIVRPLHASFNYQNVKVISVLAMISKNRLDKWTCSVQFIYIAKHALLVPTGE